MSKLHLVSLKSRLCAGISRPWQSSTAAGRPLPQLAYESSELTEW